MQKIRFTEFAELRQGDGKGPQYFAGKAYWLTDDQAARWKSEGVAEDAPADLKAENEPSPEPLRPADVKIVRTRGNRYNVVGPNEHKFNDEPVSAGDAEKLRQQVLAGELAIPVAPPELPLDAPRVIEFRRDVVDGKAKFYVLGPWPARTLIEPQVIPGATRDGVFAVNDDILNIVAANGMATYRLGAPDDQGRLPGELLDQVFEAPPAA